MGSPPTWKLGIGLTVLHRTMFSVTKACNEFFGIMKFRRLQQEWLGQRRYVENFDGEINLSENGHAKDR
jgi:hypothetical protein